MEGTWIRSQCVLPAFVLKSFITRLVREKMKGDSGTATGSVAMVVIWTQLGGPRSSPTARLLKTGKGQVREVV